MRGKEKWLATITITLTPILCYPTSKDLRRRTLSKNTTANFNYKKTKKTQHHLSSLSLPLPLLQSLFFHFSIIMPVIPFSVSQPLLLPVKQSGKVLDSFKVV